MLREIRSTRLDILFSILLSFLFPDQTLSKSVILRIRMGVSGHLVITHIPQLPGNFLLVSFSSSPITVPFLTIPILTSHPRAHGQDISWCERTDVSIYHYKKKPKHKKSGKTLV